MSTCLPTYIYTHLPTYLRTCTCTPRFAYKYASYVDIVRMYRFDLQASTDRPTDLSTYVPTNLPSYMSTCLPTYIYTHLPN